MKKTSEVSARVCTKHDTYPDGREFVGVGVIPDVEIHPTAVDIATNRDVVLGKAIEVLVPAKRANAETRVLRAVFGDKAFSFYREQNNAYSLRNISRDPKNAGNN
jgi:hypothetical protein